MLSFKNVCAAIALFSIATLTASKPIGSSTIVQAKPLDNRAAETRLSKRQNYTINVNGRSYTLVIQNTDGSAANPPAADTIQALSINYENNADDVEGTTATTITGEANDGAEYDLLYTAAINDYASDVPSDDWEEILRQYFIVLQTNNNPMTATIDIYSGPDLSDFLGDLNFQIHIG